MFWKKIRETDIIPICNLNIKLIGWEGPFNNIKYFFTIAKEAESLKSLQKSHVDSNGKLFFGNVPGLHIFNATLTIDVPGYLHIHYGKHGNISELTKNAGDVYLDGFGKHPFFTLEKLYENLPNQKINTKISALVEEIKKHSSYDIEQFLNDSLSKKGTKVKLLEQKYKNIILI